MDSGRLKPLSSCRLPVVRYREGVGSKHDTETENGARTKAVVLSMTLSPLSYLEARRFGLMLIMMVINTTQVHNL